MSEFNLSAWALKNRSVIAFFMLLALIAGILAYFRLGRSEDPTFIIKTMVVQAAWPGATVDDTLKQVTERLERKLQETPKLDFLRSFTTAGMTTIFVNLQGKTTAREVPDIWYHVRKSIGDMRHTLPVGIVGPGFNDDFGDTFGIIYGFTADGFTHRELRDYVEGVRSKLLSLADVSKIEILGAQDEKIFVEFSMQELASLGIDRSALIAALQAQNVVQPAGTIQTGYESLALRISGAFRSEQDVLNTNFAVASRMLRLSDIAKVRRGFADPPQPIFRVNGEPGLGLAIAMRDGGDILALGKNIERAISQLTIDLPLGIRPTTGGGPVGDGQECDCRIHDIPVAGDRHHPRCSFVSLGIRPGLVIALAIPLTLAIVFAVMQLVNIDMQRISLGALIIALALLVDDAMTTTDAMLSRLARGDDKVAAGTFAFRTYAFAMLAGTLVTIAGFVPVGFAASSAGEYTFSLFAVVGIALIVSWFVAVIFAPVLGVVLLKRPATGQADRPGRVVQWYQSFLGLAMRARWLTIFLTLALFIAAVLALPLVPRQFFPSSDRPELLVDLNLPQNASMFASESLARRFDATLKSDPDVERWSTNVGRGAIRFYLPLNVQLPNDFFSQAVIVAKDVPARERLRSKLEKVLADDFPSVVGRIYPLELGPPVGWPLQYRVSGPDLGQVRELAFQVAQIVAANPQAVHINFDWIEPATAGARSYRPERGPPSRTELAGAG